MMMGGKGRKVEQLKASQVQPKTRTRTRKTVLDGSAVPRDQIKCGRSKKGFDGIHSFDDFASFTQFSLPLSSLHVPTYIIKLGVASCCSYSYFGCAFQYPHCTGSYSSSSALSSSSSSSVQSCGICSPPPNYQLLFFHFMIFDKSPKLGKTI